MPIPHRFLQPTLLFFTVGCATAPAPRGGAPAPRASVAAPACVGEIGAAPAGAEAVEDAALLQASLGQAGKGQLCVGKVFEARKALRVYRVWHRARAYTEVGSWWSLTQPAGTRDRYRQENVICPEWSALDVLSVCEIKVGARFVLGPGQSARCGDGSEIGRSGVNQLFLPNDARVPRVFVENCRCLGDWPPATP